MIKDYLNRAKRSKEGNVLLANFAYLSMLQIASYLFPLLTMPYLARVIGVEGFGKIAFAAAVMIWMQTIADWGFNYTATRDVAKNRANLQLVSEIFSRVLYARILLMFLSFAILFVLILTIPKFSENRDVLLVSFLMIPGHIIFPDWFFQAMERMKFITIANILSKLTFTVAVFVFIHNREDYILQPLFVSLGFLVAGIFSLYLIVYKWGIKLIAPSFSDTILTIKICQSFISIVTRTFFPYLSRKTNNHYLYAKINLVTSSIMAILLFLLSPVLIKLLFTEDFYSSIVVMQICSFSLIFLTLSEVYGTNYMIVKGYEREVRKITVKTSIIGFLIAIPLVYYFSYIGAAIVITASRGILGLWTLKGARKIYRYE